MKSTVNKKTSLSCAHCPKRELSLFQGLDTQELDLLNSNRITVDFKKGETIYKENCKPTGLYCLNKGKVKLVKYSNKGNEVITALKRPVDFLDLETLVSGKNYNHTSVALEDSSVCIIDESHFNKVLMNNINFAKKLLQNLANTVFDNNDRFVNTTQKQIRARIAEVLLKLKEFYGVSSDGYLNVALKRSDIAALSSMTTANVIRTISAFEKEKLISCDKKKIKILNADKLHEISS